VSSSSQFRYRIFAASYISTRHNGTKAAIAAGYKRSNARHYASRLLRRPDVRAVLAETTQRVIDRLNARGGC
jgi:phage terminase small subunit